jgi:NAD-dependent dihydropyrimidine dehydrogenase PreA subunit
MKQLAVIISRSPGEDPRKRRREESILAAFDREPDVAAVMVPHLYDLHEEDAVAEALRSVPGPLVVVAWLYPRAIHWTLEQMGVKGRFGETRLHRADPEIETQKDNASAPGAPARIIWSLDLRNDDDPAMHIAEIQRILHDVRAASPTTDSGISTALPSVIRIQPSETPLPRWYPVIDFGRCNDCMECLDFCLFGVYGVDDDGHIAVESPESCKKGCPACSRVCPQNAILFPMHRTPAIAGASGANMDAQKLDLSELFGAPAAAQLAAAERNAALAGVKKEVKSRDSLDKLMDALDDAKL